VVGEGSAADGVAATITSQDKLVLTAHLRADEASLPSLRGKRVLAFAGIGDPARFFRTLRANGIEVASERAFADHHPFTQSEIEALVAEAKTNTLTLMTTEKDMARLGEAGGLPPWAQGIVSFPVRLEFDSALKLRRFVSDRLFQARDKKFRKN
jgi:tetraacyldisaccharide 4'-kinase